MHRYVSHLMPIALILAVLPLGAQTVYVPASAHVAGYGGTNWRTDVEIKACDGASAEVRLEALLRDRANPSPDSRTVSLGEGEATRLQDVLAATFGLSSAAALRVTTLSGCAFVTSRTYNDDAGGTFGQYVPAIPESEAFGFGETAELIQLSQSANDNSGYRSAVGLVNLTGVGLNMDLEFFTSGAASLGSVNEILDPYEFVQLDRVFWRVTAQAVPDGYVLVTTGTPNGRFLAYASVVDNGSGDAVFIPALRAPAAIGAAIVADHDTADAFPRLAASDIDAARAAFPKIFYGHTSHGSQIVTGLQILQNESSSLAPPAFTEISEDLGHNGDLSWVDSTRDALGSTGNGFAMVVWSWCGGASDNTPEGIATYVAAMDQLERDYPDIVFVYMTGHLDGSGPEGALHRNNEQIRSWCRAHGKVLFDFADIESWDPDGNHYPDDDDSCNWCATWCASHSCPSCGSCAHSHCFNCYRKGQAFWK
ncbi:MAG: hypothetical protein GXP47_02745, partial [Acidobacteria bacterium]|nr:hypothetical protein [Acidobacteriota bacterium]